MSLDQVLCLYQLYAGYTTTEKLDDLDIKVTYCETLAQVRVPVLSKYLGLTLESHQLPPCHHFHHRHQLILPMGKIVSLPSNLPQNRALFLNTPRLGKPWRGVQVYFQLHSGQKCEPTVLFLAISASYLRPERSN